MHWLEIYILLLVLYEAAIASEVDGEEEATTTKQPLMQASSAKKYPTSQDYDKRNSGYGTYSLGRDELPYTSLKTMYAADGDEKELRSSSFNGFGLGLGAEMDIGYRFGMLKRPVGFDKSDFGYDYIHKYRNYNLDKPITCTKVQVSEFMRPGDSFQEINIRESEVSCSSSINSCYGKMTVT